MTGPIEFAIDGKDETAWGIDTGPGARNQPRKAVFSAETADRESGRHGADVLSRARTTAAGTATTIRTTTWAGSGLSITTAPDAVADPLPHGVREILAIPREQRTPAQVQAVFSYWRTTVPEWKEANDADRGVVAGASGRLLAAGAAARATDPRETHMLTRGDFLKPAEASDARRAGVPESAAGRCAAARG